MKGKSGSGLMAIPVSAAAHGSVQDFLEAYGKAGTGLFAARSAD